MKFLILSLIMVGCSTVPKPTPSEVVIESNKPIPEVIKPTKSWKTPKYILPNGVDTSYKEAIILIQKYANTDEFANYVLSKRSKFSHTNLTAIQAVEKFRNDMDKGDELQISFYTPFIKSSAIGAWDGVSIRQNTRIRMSVIDRASHLLHETSHKYGFSHLGNYPNRNDNLNSFPYAIGDEFKKFLKLTLGE